MSDEYVKKLSQIKKDIGVIKDSIFFELFKLEEKNKRLEKENDELKTPIKAKDEVKKKMSNKKLTKITKGGSE